MTARRNQGEAALENGCLPKEGVLSMQSPAFPDARPGIRPRRSKSAARPCAIRRSTPPPWSVSGKRSRIAALRSFAVLTHIFSTRLFDTIRARPAFISCTRLDSSGATQALTDASAGGTDGGSQQASSAYAIGSIDRSCVAARHLWASGSPALCPPPLSRQEGRWLH